MNDSNSHFSFTIFGMKKSRNISTRHKFIKQNNDKFSKSPLSMGNLINISTPMEIKISERTFHRIKATLRDDYGIIIKHSRTNDGFYLDEENQ
jgi:hypothetical protein